MNKRLNDQQRKLVEDNHDLIYTFLDNHNLSIDSPEDWYGVAAIGLCRAAMHYNPDNGIKFSAYASACMLNEVCEVIRESRQYIITPQSLDEEIPGLDGCTLSDVIPDSHDFVDMIVLEDAISHSFSGLDEGERKLVELITEHGIPNTNKTHYAFKVSQNIIEAYNKYLKGIREYLSK